MPDAQDPRRRTNTVAMLGQAYSLLGFRIVDGVVGAGFPQKPSHSAVFAQINPAGSRLSELARGANMSSQAMGRARRRVRVPRRTLCPSGPGQ